MISELDTHAKIHSSLRGIANAKRREPRLCLAQQSNSEAFFSSPRGGAFSWAICLKHAYQPAPFLIQNVGYAEQVLRWKDVYVNSFCGHGICVTEDLADKLDWDTFFVKCCSEVVTQRMRPESRYLGAVGKFCAGIIQAAR